MAYVRVEVDFSDVVDDLSDDELIEELERALKSRGRTVVSTGDGDKTLAQYVERAYLAAKKPTEYPTRTRRYVLARPRPTTHITRANPRRPHPSAEAVAQCDAGGNRHSFKQGKQT